MQECRGFKIMKGLEVGTLCELAKVDMREWQMGKFAIVQGLEWHNEELGGSGLSVNVQNGDEAMGAGDLCKNAGA